MSKKLTSDEVEAKLKDVLLVLKYVQNKDVFMIYTKAHLTRRYVQYFKSKQSMFEFLLDFRAINLIFVTADL